LIIDYLILMIVTLIILLLSEILLWLVYKKHIGVLGLIPNAKRLKQFLFGFLVTASCCVLYFLLMAVVEKDKWRLNESITVKAVLSSILWVINSVLFEELIFRGALLYIAIRKIGTTKAILLSAAVFGIFHWVNLGIWGNLVPMIYIFILTATWGVMFAWAFAKTQSLYLPFGLHLGWNLFNIVVFSSGPLRDQLLIKVKTAAHQDMNIGYSIALLLLQVLLAPAILYFASKKTSLVKGKP